MMTGRAAAAGAVGFALAIASPGAAIVIRHDVDRARFVTLGDRYRQSLVQLGLISQSDGVPMLYSGMGTLVGPDWVLTAAHAADYLRGQAGDRLREHVVFIKGRGYRVREVVIHPQWDPQTQANDIALIRLAAPVQDPHPVCLYDGSDERDQVLTLAGTGYQGDGVSGPHPSDGALLGATVRVDAAEGTELRWDFRRPDDPRATPLHGISGPGDSGGPAYVDRGGETCIAGVSSRQLVRVEEGQSGEAAEGRYGVTEVYARVSAYLPWLRSVMAAR